MLSSVLNTKTFLKLLFFKWFLILAIRHDSIAETSLSGCHCKIVRSRCTNKKELQSKINYSSLFLNIPKSGRKRNTRRIKTEKRGPKIEVQPLVHRLCMRDYLRRPWVGLDQGENRRNTRSSCQRRYTPLKPTQWYGHRHSSVVWSRASSENNEQDDE